MANKQAQTNLYYPVFRGLEDEVLDLADKIYFSDVHLKVYSLKTSELLLRCSTEIESLFKDLYRREFAEKLPKDGGIGVAIKNINEKWDLSKKELLITNDRFYFSRELSNYFAPFGYRSGDSKDYYTAYNSVKHDRAKNLYKANLYILIRALGALYILNTYYTGVKLESKIFTPKTAGQSVGIFMDLGLKFKKLFESCLFIEYSEYHYPFWQEDNRESLSKIVKSLSRNDKRVLSNKIAADSSNILGIFNKLFELHNSKISVGDMLKTTMTLSKGFMDAEPAAAVNVGYERVYLSPYELQQPVNKIKDSEKVLYWDKTLHSLDGAGDE